MLGDAPLHLFQSFKTEWAASGKIPLVQAKSDEPFGSATASHRHYVHLSQIESPLSAKNTPHTEAKEAICDEIESGIAYDALTTKYIVALRTLKSI